LKLIMYRILTLISFVLVLVPTATVQAQASEADVPQDTAIIELTLPEGASFKINGQPYRASKKGEKRILPVRPLQPGRSFSYQLEVQFLDGSSIRKTLVFRGGERVRVPILSPNAQRPEFVLQTGFRSLAMNGAFTGDGSMVLLGSCELDFALYDVTTARQLRRFGHSSQSTCFVVVPLALSTNSQYAATTSWDEGSTVLWNLESGKRIRSFPAASAPLSFSPDGKWLAFCPEQDRNTSQGNVGSFAQQREIMLWATSDGVKRLMLRGHASDINVITFSRDGRFLISGANDNTAIVWNLETREQHITLADHTAPVTAACFRMDGQQILTGTSDGTATLWDFVSGRRLRTFESQKEENAIALGGVLCTAFLPDGDQIITGGGRQPTVVWDTNSGEKLRSLGDERLVTVSPDGKKILTKKILTRSKDAGTIGWTMTVRDLETGVEIQTIQTESESITPALLRADGERLYTSGMYGDSIIWNLETGTAQTNIQGSGQAFSQDGRRALSRNRPTDYKNPSVETPITIFDAETGETLHSLMDVKNLDGVVNSDGSRTMSHFIHGFVTPNGSRVAVREDTVYRVWDVSTGKSRVVPHIDPVFSPDGQYVLTQSSKTVSKLRRWDEWDTALGRDLNIDNWNVRSRPVFSPDGRLLAARNKSQDIQFWDTRTGQQLRSIADSKTAIDWKFSPDGQFFAVCHPDGKSTSIRSVLTGGVVSKLEGVSPIFGEDTTRVITRIPGSTGYVIWDTFSGTKLQIIPGQKNFDSQWHAQFPESYPDILSANGRWVASQSDEGTIELRDIATGDKLCALSSINNGRDWLVFTPEGLFDGSAGGRQKVAFRIGGGLNVVPVDQFFNDFYSPGLLAKLANGERPMPSIELGHELPPKVRIASPLHGGVIEEPSVALIIEATDQGGGVRGPWVRHNGARLLAEGRTEQTGATIRMTLDVQLVEGENRLEVEAATNNDYASISSTKAVLVLRYEKPLHKPHLHVLAVGTNYADPSLRLRFARQDAESIGQLFQTRGQALYDKVNVHLLLDEQVTKESIQDLLTRRDGPDVTIANTARPQDSLLVLFGGHGAIVGQRYFFIPHSFKRESVDLETDVKNQGLAADVLGDWLASVPCLKRMLIFDTCASGAAIDLGRTSRNPFALRGVIERLNRTQGVFTIAASAATDEAKEVPELGHGVLTYTLLAGLGAVRQGPLDGQRIETKSPEGVVSVMDWFGYADEHVPVLMNKYFGKTQDIQFSGQGTSFPVLTLEHSALR